MKTKRFYQILTVILLGLFPIYLYAESEPNNNWENANPLPKNQTMSGTLNEQDTEDWYKIEITEDCSGKFTFQTDNTLKIYYLQLYNKKENTVDPRNNFYFNNYGGEMIVQDLTRGTYYLKINRASNQGAYTLQYSTTPAKWANDIEPNNDYTKAIEMTPNLEYTGHLGYFYEKGAPDRDIEDWYKIEIKEDCEVKFTFETDKELKIYYLQLYNKKENTIELRNNFYFNNYGGEMIVQDLTKGTYYLKINRASNQGAYTLQYSTTPTKWKNDDEPNNDYTKAIEMTPNVEYTGHLGYFYKKGAPDRDTQDWYKIEITENVKIDFNFNTDNTLKIYYLTFYSLMGNNIQKRNYVYFNNYSGKMTINDVAQGTYYLKIDRGSHQGAYTLTYTTESPVTENDKEPNNKYNDSEVKTLLERQPITGQLGYYSIPNSNTMDTEDWYKVEINNDCKAEFTFETDNTLKIYYFQLYNEINDTIEKRNYVYFNNYGGKMIVPNLTKGTYYLKMSRASNQGAYTLQYSTTPAKWANDNEPNDDYKKAIEIEPNVKKTGHLGYFYKKDAPDIDRKDWYKIEIKEDCEAKFTFETDSTLRIYYLQLYNEVNDTIEQRNYVYFNNYGGKMIIPNLTKGTYYLRINLSSYQGAYTLKYSITSTKWENDNEPNDSYKKAIEIEPNVKKTGHLGYFYKKDAPDIDRKDWYKIEIKEDCEVKFTFETDSTLRIYYLRLYNEINDTIEQRNYVYFNNYGGKMIARDLTKGTYYLKIDHSSYQGAYTLKYSITSTKWENDNEPNDSYKKAIEIEPNVKKTGHLGYFYRKDAPDIDRKDWYKIEIKEDCEAKFTFETDSTLRIYYLRLYNEINDTIEQRNYVYFNNYGGKMIVRDLTKGTYYLKIDHSSNQGAYTLSYNTFPYPIPEFTTIQELNTYSFVNKTKYGETYQWDFGDGTQSDLTNPTHSYTEPGTYVVKLTATNQEGTKEITHKIGVRGIQRIESNRGGAGGKVTVSIFGGDLNSNSQILLKKNSIQVVGTNTRLVQEGELQTSFNLTNVKEGLYDLVIKESDKDDIGLLDAFSVEPEVKPEIWTEIQGRNRTLIGRWQTYNLIYGNKGNIDSKPQIIWLVTPDDPAEIDLKNITLNDVSHYPETARKHLVNVPYYLKYDSIDGEKKNVRVYGIMVPTVKANSKATIRFRVKSMVNFEVSTFITESFIDNPPANQSARMLTSVEYGSYESCVRWAIAKFVADKAVGFVLDQIPGAACAKDVINATSELSTNFGEGTTSLTNISWTIATTSWTCAKEFVGPLKAYKMTTDLVDLMIDIKSNYDADEACKKYKKKKKKKKKVRAVYSFDPNEMVGPNGFKEENFINKTSFPYTILFENKASATAPAQEVVVLDTLDATKYDISSFRFNEFGFGTKKYKAIQDSNKFVKTIDLRPDKNAILRVTGELDMLTNVVRWQFLTLDPATMDLTEDPDGGFLPPNKTKPEGEGFVSFVINPKENLKDGDIIKNRANIFFDLNKPIMTNTWINTIDQTAPISQAVSVKEVGRNGLVEIEFTNNDNNGAGVKYLDLYISTENSEFVHKYTNLPPSKKFLMKLPIGKSYGFYTLATDSLDFVETPKNKAEVTLKVTSTNEIKLKELISIYPNPATEFINVKLNKLGDVDEKYTINLKTIDGKQVKQLLVKSTRLKEGIKLPIKSYASGFYVLQISNKGTISTKSIIIK